MLWPRVLRLPGTRNHKACEFGHAELESGEAISQCEGKPVRLLKLEPTLRYRWQDFADFIPEPAPKKPATAYEGGKQDYHDLPKWLKDKIEAGAPQGERSEAIFDVVLNLLRRGWEEDEIEALFQAIEYASEAGEW